MIGCALLAVALAAASPLPDGYRSMANGIVEPALANALKPIASAYRAATAPAKPTVEAVRTKLRQIRTLEAKARPFLTGRKGSIAARYALAIAWVDLGDLESALAEKGEGKSEATREAVRQEAQARADDAYTIAKFAGPMDPDAIARVLPYRMPALKACWQEHLLSRAKPDAVDATATLSLTRGHVTQVKFAPELRGPRAHLGECLTTRLLGFVVTDDAEAIELPLHFTAQKN